MSNEVRIGSLLLKFLIDDADNNGRLTMFEMIVPERAKVPAAHYHRDFEEVWYGLGGALTVTLNGVAHKLKAGDSLFVPRGAVHRFDNFGNEDVKQLAVISPAIMGPAFFREAAEVISASAGGPPDRQKMMDVFRRHGMTVAASPLTPSST